MRDTVCAYVCAVQKLHFRTAAGSLNRGVRLIRRRSANLSGKVWLAELGAKFAKGLAQCARNYFRPGPVRFGSVRFGSVRFGPA